MYVIILEKKRINGRPAWSGFFFFFGGGEAYREDDWVAKMRPPTSLNFDLHKKQKKKKIWKNRMWFAWSGREEKRKIHPSWSLSDLHTRCSTVNFCYTLSMYELTCLQWKWGGLVTFFNVVGGRGVIIYVERSWRKSDLGFGVRVWEEWRGKKIRGFLVLSSRFLLYLSTYTCW